MARWTAAFAGAWLCLAVAVGADAQTQYPTASSNPPAYTGPPYNQAYSYSPPPPDRQPQPSVLAGPAASSYDPYVDGTVATPNAGGGP
jgi:hypothetical protein